MPSYIKCNKCGEFERYDNGFSLQIQKLVGSSVDKIGRWDIDLCRKCSIELLTECNKMEEKE